MTLIVRDAILAARDLSPAFDKQSTPDPVALRFVARYQQRLLTEITRWKADALHVAQSIPLPLADFVAGVAVDPYLVLHGGTVYYTDTQRDPDPLELVEYEFRLARWTFPGAYVLGSGSDATLVLLGHVEDWSDVARVDLDLFPQGDDEVGMDDALLLPGSPLATCVDAIAEFMASRTEGASYRPDGSRDSYLDEVTGRHRAKVGRIREDF